MNSSSSSAINSTVSNTSNSSTTTTSSDHHHHHHHLDLLSSRNKRGFLSAVSPDVSRIDSSNLNPLDYWNTGVQMIAMNYQVIESDFFVVFGVY